MAFGKPMVWREMKDHNTECYFCMTNLKSINCKNAHHVQYPGVPSATKPVPHITELPVPNVNVTVESSAGSEAVHGSVSTDQDADDQAQPQPFTEGELNNLTRDLNISKESAQLLGSRLRKKRLLAPTTTFYWNRQREAEFTTFFMHDEPSILVYCYNIADFTESLGVTYIALEWRFFIDSSNRSPKVIFSITEISFHLFLFVTQQQ